MAGVLSFALALAGEIILRSVPAAPAAPDPAVPPQPNLIWLGNSFMITAVLLVGLVAWVNDDFHVDRKRADAAVEEDISDTPLVARTARSRAAQQMQTTPLARQQGLGATLRAWGLRYAALRTRVGWVGTAIGLVVALGLAAWLALILRENWQNPLAGWVWLAIMAVLALTFVGVRPWPRGASLITHDPAEPAYEPPVSRNEWIVLGVIMAAAVVLRFWHLDSIPAGPYIDEAGRALDARNLNYGLPVNREPFVFFGTGWWGVPSFYFWQVAQSMKVFGDNLLGARVIHALAGIATVWFTYRFGRVAWSPRVGLVAAALIAISDFAIQASRTAGESTITLFFWTACFYFLLKALKTRQPVDFVLAGLSGGFVLLGYASGKLLPVFLALAAAYLLFRWGFTGMRRYLPGLVLMAVTAAVVCGPNLIYQFTQKPSAMTERYTGVTIFNDAQKANLATQYGTDNWGLIVAHQYVKSYSAYDVGKEVGPFYPTGLPVLPLPWAALWVLGTAYVVWRLGDARYAVLAVWLLGALAGSAFTIDTPTLQRALMVIPLLALLPAIFLDRLATSVPPLFKYRVPSTQYRVTPALRNWVTGGLLVALVLFSAFQTLIYYFGPYTAQANYLDFALAGQYIEKLDPRHDVVYHLGLPVMFGDPSPLVFQSKNIEMRDLGNIADVLPITENNGRDVHFMVGPPVDDPLVGLLKSYYPGGTTTILSKPDGKQVVLAYKVKAKDIDSRRIMSARYGMPDGALYERPEPRLGTIDTSQGNTLASLPPGLSFPTTAEWLGGLVSPAYGTYRMQIDAPAGAFLEIDGNQVLTATAGAPPADGRVVMTKGIHTVRLHGTLDSESAQMELRWGTDNGPLVPVGREFFWGGPQGTLAGEVYGIAGSTNWLMPDQIPAPNVLPLGLRHDGVFSWINLSYSLQAGPSPFVVWRGKLLAPTEGTYYFEALTPGAVTIRIDDQLVGISNVPGTPNQWPVNMPLAVGEHTFEMRYAATQDNAPFQLVSQAPGKARAVFSPESLLPAESGAWVASADKPVGSPDSALIHSMLPKKVEVASTKPVDGWSQALGIAVLADGRFAVGDSGAHRLIIYSTDGKQQATWGGTPTGEDTFNDVSDLETAPDGSIVALDAENADIRLFDAAGHQTLRLSREKLGLTHARGIAIGPDGKYYVADTGGSRVVRINQGGEVETVYQQGTTGIDTLNQPMDVAVTPDGMMYAVDLLGRIVQFDPSGAAQKTWKVPIGGSRGGSKLAVWDGLIVVSNPDGGSLSALDPQSGSVLRISTTDEGPLAFNGPTGLAVGQDGRLYVVDSANNRVVVLKEAGAP